MTWLPERTIVAPYMAAGLFQLVADEYGMTDVLLPEPTELARLLGAAAA